MDWQGAGSRSRARYIKNREAILERRHEYYRRHEHRQLVSFTYTIFDLQGKRVKGIEPSCAAWEAAVLPLNYTRMVICDFRFAIADCKPRTITARKSRRQPRYPRFCRRPDPVRCQIECPYQTTMR
jgi:hypothetical protein